MPSPPHSVDMRTETTVEASLIAARLAEVEHLLVQAESRARKEASDLRVLRDHLRDQLS